MERQHYYRQLIASLVETHFQEKIDLTKSAESILPEVQIDLFFEIPKEKLSLVLKSPFPCFKEANLVHIKAVNDRLTKLDLLQYIGELYVKGSTNNFVKEKSIALTIISAEEVIKSLFKETQYSLEKTEYPWIEKIRAEYPAYLFTMEKIPLEEEDNWVFLPFLPLRVLEKSRKQIRALAEKREKNAEYKLVLLCLSKLQPEYFKKEFGAMPFIDTKEMAKEFFPKASEALKTEGLKKGKIEGKIEGEVEGLLKVLNWTAPDVAEKYREAIQKAKTEKELKAVEAKIQKELTQQAKTKKKNP